MSNKISITPIRGEKPLCLVKFDEPETSYAIFYFFDKIDINARNRKNLVKPHFSYYKSIKDANYKSDNDINASLFYDGKFDLRRDVNDEEWDAEVILINKSISEEDCILMFDTINGSDNIKSLYDTVSKLEDFFGLVWKSQRELQIGLIGELLVMKNNPDYKERLIQGWHLEQDGNRRFKSKSDFMLYDKSGKLMSIEVKSTISKDNLFTIKNDQLEKNINDYFCLVRINEDKNGETVLSLVEWYMKQYKELPSDFTIWLEKQVKSFDTRKLIKFSNDSTKIQFVKREEIPKIKTESDEVKDITFKSNLFKLDEILLKDILD